MLLALAGPGAFTLAAAVGSRLEPGYRSRDEPISALAAHGTQSAAVMVPGFLGLALGSIGLARALLIAPDYLFLDEATASLDEDSEATLYRLLEQKLTTTTIVSIGHRSTLEAFHQRNVRLAREGDLFALEDRQRDPVSS